jgi:hypothetical protein
MFGLSGGLIPCPAAITDLLLCVQYRATAKLAGQRHVGWPVWSASEWA